MFKPILACNADLSKIRYPVYASAKLDGIRCLCINGRAMSRSMKPIPNRYIQEQFARYADLLEGLDGIMKTIELYAPEILPMAESFRFIGLDSEGKRYRCEVVKGIDGCHRVEGMPFKDLVSWTNNLADLK